MAVAVLAVALAIRIEDGGPVIHVQSRTGRDGRTFRMVRFRTMARKSERASEAVPARRSGGRRTRVGAVLRRLHLEEMPQAVNVLRGEMSLVGPRPERPKRTARIMRRLPAFGNRPPQCWWRKP